MRQIDHKTGIAARRAIANAPSLDNGNCLISATKLAQPAGSR